ncbi:serine protease persephone isoform X2 [Cephus cinctus]|uniref:chymotrypsin n=1 Tax=Cephus cinctus TaxID=211228 RepID=A0AAJ7R8M3_CEPCN|nr:serine protease persephone isoform X2 [Cephus cinctus]
MAAGALLCVALAFLGCLVSSFPFIDEIYACQQYYNEVTSEGVVFHILGGEATSPGEFPYLAALGYLETDEDTEGVIKYSCGGTLISSQHVLTAAHCVSNINDQVPIEVRLGSEDLESSDPIPQRIPISSIIPHPSYKRSVNYNDIAIVKLKTPARLTNTVKPICLQTKSLTTSQIPANASLVVTGWGATSSFGDGSTKLLKAAGLRFIEKDSCSKLYTEFRRLPRGLDDGMICALDSNTTRRADACQGDSGGPLLMLSENSQTVVGVTSFGQACGGPSPGVYTSVYSYLDWIEAQVWPDQASD